MNGDNESILEALQGYYFEDLSLDMEEEFTKTITDNDVRLFADISGDTNPVHLNDDYAKETRFKARIAHGILTSSFISTVIGTKLPGPGSIYVSQTQNFRAPVYIGDTVTAKVKVTKLVERKNFVELNTTCWVGDTCVVKGEAVVMVPSKGRE